MIEPDYSEAEVCQALSLTPGQLGFMLGPDAPPGRIGLRNVVACVLFLKLHMCEPQVAQSIAVKAATEARIDGGRLMVVVGDGYCWRDSDARFGRVKQPFLAIPADTALRELAERLATV